MDACRYLTEEEVHYNEFEHYCVTGCTLRAMMVKEKYHVDVNRCQNSSFILSCRYGYVGIAKWIYSVNPDKFAEDDYCIAYQYAMRYGHLEVTNWIITLIKNNEDLMQKVLYPDCDYIALYDEWLAHRQYCRLCVNCK